MNYPNRIILQWASPAKGSFEQRSPTPMRWVHAPFIRHVATHKPPELSRKASGFIRQVGTLYAAPQVKTSRAISPDDSGIKLVFMSPDDEASTMEFSKVGMECAKDILDAQCKMNNVSHWENRCCPNSILNQKQSDCSFSWHILACYPVVVGETVPRKAGLFRIQIITVIYRCK